jgi:hypothetical protein
MIVVKIKDKISGIEKDLQIAKTLSGDYLMREHPEVDIVIMPEKQKILLLPKNQQNDYVYHTQEEIFAELVKKGVISPETITGGNIFGALQAVYPQQAAGGEDPLQVVIYNLANYIEQQRPTIAYQKAYEDELEKALLEPDTEESTEIGEVPQEPFKGSVPKYGFPTRGIYRYNY